MNHTKRSEIVKRCAMGIGTLNIDKNIQVEANSVIITFLATTPIDEKRLNLLKNYILINVKKIVI